MILFFILHYGFIERVSKRENIWLAMTLTLLSILYTAYMFYYEKGEWNKHNVMSLLPTVYLISAIGFRYLIFNKWTRKLFKEKKPPFDPEIIFPGVLWVTWENKKYNPSILEYVYSFGILFFPWIIIYFLF
jgi:hypothetical protein